MARIIYTPLAEADLAAIGCFIATQSHSLSNAERFIETLRAKCDLYATEPELGELCPEIEEKVRRFAIGNYVLFYWSVDGGIELLRVLHGSRDIPQIWEHD